jgi:hypothetical protein
MRTWTKLGLAVLLATSSAAAPAHADQDKTAEKVEKLQKDLDALRRDVEALKQQLADSNLRGARSAEDIREMKDLLIRLVRRQDDLMNGQGRTSAYPPSMPPAGAPATVYVQNRYAAAATVSINGRPYTVAPFQTAEVRNIPLGPFTYEVSVDGYGVVQPPTTATLGPTGHTVTIFPR